MMDANKAVQYQNPAHVHSQSEVIGLADDMDAKADRVSSDPGDLHVTGDISPDATGWYRRNGTYNASPAYERIGGGWWIRYEGSMPWSWRIGEGESLGSVTARWASGPLFSYPGTTPTVGQYSAMAGATGTAVVTLGEIASDYLASFDENGNLVRVIPQSRVPMQVDGVYSFPGKVQEGHGTANGVEAHAEGNNCVACGVNSHAEGISCIACGAQSHAEGSGNVAGGMYTHAEGITTVAAGNYSHSEGSGNRCGYTGDQCTISATTVTISGDVRSHFAMSESVVFWNLSGAEGSAEAQQRTVSSAPAYSGGNTTFSINATLNPAHTSGKVASQNIGRYGHAEGFSNTILSDSGHAEGSNNSIAVASASAHVEGDHCTASANYAHAEGYYTTASAQGSHASGYYTNTNKQFQRALASGRFAAGGDCQYTEIVLRRATTNETPAELTIDGAAPSGTIENTSNRFILATGKTYACLARIVARKSDGTSAFFLRQVLAKNVGGTVSLEGTMQTVGTDINPAGWTVPTITADNTNRSLVITVTGAAATNIRWSATIQAQEILY